MRYEIEDGAIKVFLNEDQEAPHLFQPHWPNGDAWEEGEAEAWAEQYILSIQDEEADLPGPSRETPTVKRPTAEEYEAVRNAQPLPITQAMLERIVETRVAEILAERGIE